MQLDIGLRLKLHVDVQSQGFIHYYTDIDKVVYVVTIEDPGFSDEEIEIWRGVVDNPYTLGLLYMDDAFEKHGFKLFADAFRQSLLTD